MTAPDSGTAPAETPETEVEHTVPWSVDDAPDDDTAGDDTPAGDTDRS